MINPAVGEKSLLECISKVKVTKNEEKIINFDLSIMSIIIIILLLLLLLFLLLLLLLLLLKFMDSQQGNESRSRGLH